MIPLKTCSDLSFKKLNNYSSKKKTCSPSALWTAGRMTSLAAAFVRAAQKTERFLPSLRAGPVPAYTLVSGSHDPLTRRYAPVTATPYRDHSDRAPSPLRRFSARKVWQKKGGICLKSDTNAQGRFCFLFF